MTVYQKARELAELILASEESIHAADSRANYMADEAAMQKMAEYTDFHNEIQLKMEEGQLTQDEFHSASDKLQKMGAELKKDPVIGKMISAENQMNALVNKVILVLKSAIQGDIESAEANSGCNGCKATGGCSGCKEAH